MSECPTLFSVYNSNSQPCLGIRIPVELKKKIQVSEPYPKPTANKFVEVRPGDLFFFYN